MLINLKKFEPIKLKTSENEGTHSCSQHTLRWRFERKKTTHIKGQPNALKLLIYTEGPRKGPTTKWKCTKTHTY